MIDLFEHNQTAYESALRLLHDTGKAAIVHPTGTGKSFIGFKLCEDHPLATVCWLGPSEYIFRTQVENVMKACGRLCGEVLWEQGGKKAFKQSEEQAIKESAKEVFKQSEKKLLSSQTNNSEKPVGQGGYDNIALLENIQFFTYAKLMLMTEAELAEINPGYIILDEFHRCGAEMWGQGVQNLLGMYPEVPVLGLSATSIRYLDNQRDMAAELFDGCLASEMTLGEAIVRGILTPPKYVLSLYSYEQDLIKYEKRVANTRNHYKREQGEKYLEALRRALEQAEGLDEIFCKHMPDKAGKYIVFCANREHMEEMIGKVPEWFAKVDEHPLIYRAYSDDPETGKAFAAFKVAGVPGDGRIEAPLSEEEGYGFTKDRSEDSLAFAESHLKLLFCIDMLNEGIHVEDISGVILFRPTVSPIVYKQQIGRAMTAGGKKEAVIFDIVNNVRNLYSIGAIEEEMAETMSAFRFHGAEKQIVHDSFEIMDEVQDCRQLFEDLESLLTYSWDEMYLEAEKYFGDHGHLRVPSDYVTDAGLNLGAWIVTQRGIYNGRNIGTLTAEQIAKLEEIGMCWLTVHDRIWEGRYAEAEAHYRERGNLKPPYADEGLRVWIYAQRRKYREKTLAEERVDRLNRIGMVWETEDPWERMYAQAKKYFETHGNLDIPAEYETAKGESLGQWYRRNVTEYRKGILGEEKLERLKAIGFEEEAVKARTWMRYYEEAQKYRSDHGNLRVHADYVTENGLKLGTWISGQRYSYGLGRLSEKRVQLLSDIGMEWQSFDARWMEGYRHLEEYICGLQAGCGDQLNGGKPANGVNEAIGTKRETVGVPVNLVSADGYRLGTWAANQRALYAKGKLARWKVEKLEEAGMKLNDGRKRA